MGEYSSGKSSLLNTLIGHDFNIILVDIKVCTNIEIVIKYTKNIKNISLFHAFLEQTPQNFYFFKSDKEPLAEDLNSINFVLNLINILYSSFKDKEDFQNNILEYIKNINKLDKETKIYVINNLLRVLKKEISMDEIYDTDLKQNFENLFSFINQNDSSLENKDFFKKAFFLLNIPIETYDLLNLSDE